MELGEKDNLIANLQKRFDELNKNYEVELKKDREDFEDKLMFESKLKSAERKHQDVLVSYQEKDQVIFDDNL